LARGWIAFALNSGSPQRAARLADVSVVAEPCQMRGAPANGRGRLVTSESGGREPAGPRDLLFAPQAAQQFVLLRELVPLLAVPDAEHRQLPQLVTLADDQLNTTAGQLVDSRVILRDPERVEDGQDGDAGLDADPAGRRGDRPEEDSDARGQERPRVTLAQRDGVEAELLGVAGGGDRLLKPFGGADEPAGDRVLDVGQDVEELKPHALSP
jgi:hypothetical protein